METKRLYKSQKDKMVSGVLAGIAHYYNIDPTLVRIAFVFVAFLTALFPALICYIVLGFVIPNE